MRDNVLDRPFAASSWNLPERFIKIFDRPNNQKIAIFKQCRRIQSNFLTFTYTQKQVCPLSTFQRAYSFFPAMAKVSDQCSFALAFRWVCRKEKV